MTTITPFLWFNDNAEQAIERYLKVFDDAELVEENRLQDGRLFIATIRLQGQTLTLMNGGPDHKLTEAFSLSVGVETQEEVDSISDALIEGGGEQGPCGWLVDAFGLSWQVVPSLLMRVLSDPDREKAGRAQEAMMQMKRLNLQGLQDAFDGKA
jgi:predicted 3-demethylubiquinone-9 3-methyltransferase (glyoxalase superfamily)